MRDAKKAGPAAAQACKALQSFLRGRGQTLQLSREKVEHVLGVSFGLDSRQVPRPRAARGIQRQQTFVCQLSEELDHEERVPSCFLVHSLHQRLDLSWFKAERVMGQFADVVFTQRREVNFLYLSRPPNGDQGLAERMLLSNFV